MPSLARVSPSRRNSDGGSAVHSLTYLKQSANLDDVAASAVRLSARQQPKRSAGGLDAIPPLTRPLNRLRIDTPVFGSRSTQDCGASVYNGALRLLATSGFEHGKLQRAVDGLLRTGGGGANQSAEIPIRSTSFMCAWLDDAEESDINDDDMSTTALQEKYYEALVLRSMDHLRLEASMAFQNNMSEHMDKDLEGAKYDLVNALRASIDPSAAVPSPFCPLHGEVTRTPAMKTTSSVDKIPYAASTFAAQTDQFSSILTQRSRSPGCLQHAGSARPSPDPKSGSVMASPPHVSTPNPRNVISAAPALPYLEVFRDYIFGSEAPSSLARRLLETAQQIGDHYQFLTCLSLLTQFSDVAAAKSADKSDSTGANLTASESGLPMPTQDEFICISRSALEDLFALSIGTVPVDRRHRSPAAVRVGVYKYVEFLSRSNSLHTTLDPRETAKSSVLVDGQPFWPQFYYCLRCGSPAAALELCNLAHAEIDEEGSHIRYFMDEFVTSTRQHRRTDEDGVIVMDDDDADIVLNPPGCLLNQSTYESLVDEYNDFVYYSSDPYRRASYILLARFDASWMAFRSTAAGSIVGRQGGANSSVSGMSSHSSHGLAAGWASFCLRDDDYDMLFSSAEDYFWLKLWMCRLEREDKRIQPQNEVEFLTLPQIQDEVLNFGQAHFDSSPDSCLLFPFIMFVVGMPWQAIELMSSKQSPVLSGYAACLALPLHALKWCPDERKYASVLWSYCIHFAIEFPAEAALCMFSLNSARLLQACLEKLVLESERFAPLLGDGLGSKGALEEIAVQVRSKIKSDLDDGTSSCSEMDAEELLDFVRELKQRIAVSLASELEKALRSGNLEAGSVAAQLYRIGGDAAAYRRSTLLSLSRLVSSYNSSQLRTDARTAAESCLSSFNSSMSSVQQRAFHVVLRMCDFYDCYWANDLDKSWTVLEEVGLFPLELGADANMENFYRNLVDAHDRVVISAIPEWLQTSLDIAEKVLLRTSPVGEGGVDVCKPSQVAALVTFAGMLGLSETELNARLVRLELLLA